ncbi:hypothetical protein chiPu_0024574, partial [Chiloscyllium punctatum]|nr:hypothetical protein [Chiloscyllium punctatum]
FVNGSDDLREQDPRFRNRTNLFKDQLEQGNWSVLISDLRETDQDEYDCQIYSKMGDQLHWEKVVQVNLCDRASSYTWTEHTCYQVNLFLNYCMCFQLLHLIMLDRQGGLKC